MRKYFLVAAAALMLVGCTKEQSEFNSKDLENDVLPHGTVVGTVKYDAGAYKDANGVIFQEHFVPAAGQKVKIEVSNASYVTGSAGDQTFLADIDQDGKFSYTLPLGLNNTNVKVSVVPFYAEKKVVAAGEIVSIPDALYNTGVGPTTKQMTNKDIKTYDFNVTSDATVAERMSKTLSVSGKVLVQQWVWNKDASKYDIKTQVDEKKWKLVCEIKTWNDAGETYMNYTKTGIQTNNEGIYSFTVNLPDNWKSMTNKPQLKVTLQAELDTDFTGRYYDNEKGQWKSQTCTVLYPSISTSKFVSEDNELVPLKFNDLTVFPELQDKAGIKGIGNNNIDAPEGPVLYSQGALNYKWNW
jgi:hypothetical protein